MRSSDCSPARSGILAGTSGANDVSVEILLTWLRASSSWKAATSHWLSSAAIARSSRTCAALSAFIFSNRTRWRSRLAALACPDWRAACRLCSWSIACAFAGRCQLFGYLKSLTGFQGLDLTTHLVLLGLQCLCTLSSPSALMLCCVQVPAQSGDTALRAVLSQLRAGILAGRQPRSTPRKLLLQTG